MRKDITVAAVKRDSRGKNEARRSRVRGKVPAVVYGPGGGPVPVVVDPKELMHILHSPTGHNTIFNLRITDGEVSPVMIVDWQRDPAKGHLLHADLKRIDLTKPVVVKVPVHTTGEPKGVKQQDGLLELVAREIEIKCLPDDIPEMFTVDVTELMMGQSKRAADIALDAGIELLSPPDAVVAHVVALRIVAAEAEAEAAPVAEGAEAPAPAEPEVIKKGKKEEEGEVAEAKGKKK